jgi:hypothetical protein
VSSLIRVRIRIRIRIRIRVRDWEINGKTGTTVEVEADTIRH